MSEADDYRLGAAKAYLSIAQAKMINAYIARNYRIKRALGRCREPRCKVEDRLLVVRVAPGEDDSSFSLRCERHLGDLERTQGQWIDWRPGLEAAIAKVKAKG